MNQKIHVEEVEKWLTDDNPDRRFLAAKSIIMNGVSRQAEAVGIIEELPNDDSLLGARVRRSLATFQNEIMRNDALLCNCSYLEREVFVTGELRKAVASIGELESAEEVDSWTVEEKRDYCDSTLREFAAFPRYKNRTTDAASFLVRFGKVGLRSILDSVYDDDENVRLFSITCISELLLTHFQAHLAEIADILDHKDTRISGYVPRMLWRSNAEFAIPKLEATLNHEDKGLAALCAKSIVIIDPSRRKTSLEFVEGLEINDFFRSKLLAELSGEKPHGGR